MPAEWVYQAERQFPDKLGEREFIDARGDLLKAVAATVSRRHALAVQLEALLNEHGAASVLEALGLALGAPIPGVSGGEDE